MHQLAANALWVARTLRDDVRRITDTGVTQSPYRQAFSPAMAGLMQDRGLEWLSALVMLGCGMVLGMPGALMVGPAYEAFHRYGTTEDFWAVTLGMCGAARIVALYINGRWPRTPLIRMGGALFGAVSWGQIAYMLGEARLMQDGQYALGLVPFIGLAVSDLFSIFRAAFDARYHSP